MPASVAKVPPTVARTLLRDCATLARWSAPGRSARCFAASSVSASASSWSALRYAVRPVKRAVTIIIPYVNSTPHSGTRFNDYSNYYNFFPFLHCSPTRSIKQRNESQRTPSGARCEIFSIVIPLSDSPSIITRNNRSISYSGTRLNDTINLRHGYDVIRHFNTCEH